MSFKTNIFINCPFDAQYRRLFEPLIFTCLYCGLEPQISKLEDSGAVRLQQIIKLIKQSKYSIHDLSRMKSQRVGEFARFNMPFELGLDLGIRQSGNARLKEKKCLILDKEKHRYQAALSDLSGSDIKSYGKRDQVEHIIKEVRHWFIEVLGPGLPPGNKIFLDYFEFVSDLQINLEKLEFDQDDIKHMSITEYIHFAKEWIENRDMS